MVILPWITIQDSSYVGLIASGKLDFEKAILQICGRHLHTLNESDLLKYREHITSKWDSYDKVNGIR